MFREKLQGKTKNLAISETARNNKVVVYVAIFVPRFGIPLHRKLLILVFFGKIFIFFPFEKFQHLLLSTGKSIQLCAL